MSDQGQTLQSCLAASISLGRNLCGYVGHHRQSRAHGQPLVLPVDVKQIRGKWIGDLPSSEADSARSGHLAL